MRTWRSGIAAERCERCRRRRRRDPHVSCLLSVREPCATRRALAKMADGSPERHLQRTSPSPGRGHLPPVPESPISSPHAASSTSQSLPGASSLPPSPFDATSLPTPDALPSGLTIRNLHLQEGEGGGPGGLGLATLRRPWRRRRCRCRRQRALPPTLRSPEDGVHPEGGVLLQVPTMRHQLRALCVASAAARMPACLHCPARQLLLSRLSRAPPPTPAPLALPCLLTGTQRLPIPARPLLWGRLCLGRRPRIAAGPAVCRAHQPGCAACPRCLRCPPAACSRGGAC